MRDLAELLNAMREAGIVTGLRVVRGNCSDALHRACRHARRRRPGLPARSESTRSARTIYEFCAGRGHVPDGEAIRVGAWPVQFIPVFDALTRDALKTAETADFEGVPFRVVGAAHLALIALSVGRAKDYARILALLEAGAVERQEMASLASRHGLDDAWARFTRRFLDD